MSAIAAPELTLAFTPRGNAAEIFIRQDPELVLSGPAGTGKSRTILEKVHLACLLHPQLRALMTRKTRVSLTESAMVTFEKQVLGPELGTNVYWKASTQRYEYPRNDSIVAVGGLDRPSKVMSSEWDLIYVQEATELDENDWEALTTRLRNGKNSYQQLIADCNPGPPTHWLKQRANAGRTVMLESRHEDNPLLFGDDGSLTPEGARYLAVLDSLSGVRLARYRYGIWASAEGTIYEDAYDRARNVIKPFPIPSGWPRYLWIDFGYTNPFVCHWAAQDPDGRLYVYRELYMTKRLVEDHVKTIKQHSRWGESDGDPLPRAVICDHDAEDRATFERHSGLMTTPAHKSVSDGIQAMAARLRPAGDGKPRLAYFEHCLIERDLDLASRKRPTCAVEEFDSYVWRETPSGIKDEPKKEDDHGMDTDRYGVAYFDLQPTGVTYYPSIWR